MSLHDSYKRVRYKVEHFLIGVLMTFIARRSSEISS